MNLSRQAGFTAVELLITLFVAAAFLISGYQLYFVVIRDSGLARSQANASNVAYDYLTRYSPQTPNPCSGTTTPLPSTSISVANLSNVTVSVVMTCPYSTLTNVTKVTASVTYTAMAYNTSYPNQTVVYSTYVTQ